jgi:hypothetical protein
MAHSDYLMRTLQQLAHTLAALFGGARGRDLAETMSRLDVISGTFTGLSLPVLRGMSYDDLYGLFSVTGAFAVERTSAPARPWRIPWKRSSRSHPIAASSSRYLRSRLGASVAGSHPR